MTGEIEEYIPDEFEPGELFEDMNNPHTEDLLAHIGSYGWAQVLLYDPPDGPATYILHDDDGEVAVMNRVILRDSGSGFIVVED